MSWETSEGVKIDHPFFRHCQKQTEHPVSGTVVHGEIPKWLTGTLIRNGPGIQKIGNTSYNHLFDGLAILHKFEIKDGKATYQSRALESDAHQKNFAANRIVVSEFGTYAFPDPCQSILGRLQAKFESVLGKNKSEMEMTDNCSVNVGFYGDQLYAMTETVFIRRVDPESLKCIGEKTRIRNYCALNTATAHPHCFEDGTILNVGNNFRHKRGPHYCFVKVPPVFNSDETAYKDATIIAEVPSRWKFSPCYFHSFGMTKDKIIFIESPLCLDVMSMMASPLFNKSYEGCMKWYPNEKAKIHVISMVDGKPHPITYETDSFFTFHHINAYEEEGCLIVDVAAYKDAEFVKNATPSSLGKDTHLPEASARRYILPLTIEGSNPGDNLIKMANTTATAKLRSGTKSTVDLTHQSISKDWVELPRINYANNGMKYNFFYAIRSNEILNYAVPEANIITKVNVTDGTALDYVSKGIFVSEPIFCSNPNSTGEDDGVVLTTVFYDDPTEISLVVLNASDMTEVCDIKYKADGVVTATFHGIWTNSK